MPPTDPGPCRWRLPDPAKGHPGVDVLAVGGDLAPATLLAGYRNGLFAMHLSDDLLGWFSPDPRGILTVPDLHVSRSLRRSCRRFTATTDAAFEAVVAGCARSGRSGDWITPGFEAAYLRLHRLGWAHSVEIWQDGVLAGGLFGVEVGGLFSGESMFHRRTDASKAALVALVALLRDAGGQRLLDVQWWTPHLDSLGAVSVPRAEYLRRLAAAVQLSPAFSEVRPHGEVDGVPVVALLPTRTT